MYNILLTVLQKEKVQLMDVKNDFKFSKILNSTFMDKSSKKGGEIGGR